MIHLCGETFFGWSPHVNGISRKKLALKRRTCVGLSETLNLSEATCAERPIQWLEDSSLLTYTTSNCCLYSSKYYLKIPNKSHHFWQKFFKYSNFPAKKDKDCSLTAENQTFCVILKLWVSSWFCHCYSLFQECCTCIDPKVIKEHVWKVLD